mmetsp:Transcript_2531/g.3689  ORF Transcript_2531/g.3689 Transcript_2531/m.3689 type:complete len:141 (+) Transcript_2531:1369-1791(+)
MCTIGERCRSILSDIPYRASIQGNFKHYYTLALGGEASVIELNIHSGSELALTMSNSPCGGTGCTTSDQQRVVTCYGQTCSFEYNQEGAEPPAVLYIELEHFGTQPTYYSSLPAVLYIELEHFGTQPTYYSFTNKVPICA